MAATGYSPIQIYYSTTTTAVPTAGNLASGELAINITDGILFYKDNAGSVQTLATKAGTSGTYTSITLSGGTANGIAYLNGSKVVTTGSALTFDGATLTQTVSDAGTSNKWSGATGKVRLRPYADSTYGSIFDSTNSAESAYLPLSFFASNIYSAADTALIWRIAGSETMRLTSTGLGIGTSSPVGRLTLRGAAGTSGKNQGISLEYSNGTEYGALGLNNSSGWPQLMARANAGITFHVNSDLVTTGEAMRLDSSGNLGLGVTPSAWSSPQYRAIQFPDGWTALASDSGNGTVLLGSNFYADGNTTYKYVNSNYATLYQQNLPSGQHRWYTAPSGTAGNAISFTQAMTLDASGNLVVGATATVSSSRLYVQSSGNTTVARFYGPGLSDSNHAVYFDKPSATNTTSQCFVGFSIDTQTVASGQINANGASQAAFGSFSDRRLKKNIVDLSPQLANIMNLRPVEFDYIESEGGGHQVSFIAQEFEEVYSDAVGERADGMKTLTGWGKTEARLVKAIQEQQALIQQLTARVAALES